MARKKLHISRRISQMNMALIYILVSVVIGVVGQILLKIGMNHFGELSLSVPWKELIGILWQIGTNPYVFFGLAVYVLSSIFWLVALSHVDLSYAYPIGSLSYGFTLFGSWLVLGEKITPLQLLGTLIICGGVVVISRG
jgi:drug/metabolite transporter (DMT)-like permease